MSAPAPMRIALLASDWVVDGPTGRGGGIETYVRVMAEGLAAAGHDVHVIARAEHHTHTTVRRGVHLHGVHVPDEWPAAAVDLGEAREALAFAWHAWRQIRALTASDGPFAIVEAPEYKAQGYYAARDRGLPLVVKCHAHLKLCLDLNGVPLDTGTALLADLERETLVRARAVHTNSRALAERCGRDYGLPTSRFAHVPYGIDTRRFAATPSALRQTWGLAGTPVALFVGRMEPRKGIDMLVPAFAALVARMPEATLVVAGPDTVGPAERGSYWQHMAEAWAAAGVPPERVRLLGPVAHESLPAIYSACDVMVAPSPYEAFGLVYLEAMACGCVPIGCAAGGVPAIVADGVTGRLVPPGDAAALTAVMAEVLADPEQRQRMAAAGRLRVEQTYSLDAVVARTEAFYREVAA